MNYQHAFFQLTEIVMTHLSVTKGPWKNVSHKVMKIVYWRSTYILSVLIIGLNITCT